MANAYALIMAGGAGTRLWPLSRQARPKPLIRLVEPDRSMFQIAVERLDPLFPPERILVVANPALTPLLQAQAPALPAENFIVEPSGRDTAPAVGLGAVHIRHRDPEGVMAVLTADHHIADEAAFRQALGAAVDAAAGGSVVTMGIRPAFASTGFGYIEMGEVERMAGGVALRTLRQFREKPDAETAQAYLASGHYAWNSGMFIWPVARVMGEFERHAPDIHASLSQIAAAIGTPRYDEVLADVWPGIRRTSVDYALMENVRKDAYVIPVEMGWSDIGNFGTLYEVLSGADDNAALGQEPLVIDSSGLLVYSDRLVAAVGLQDVVIIDAGEALLVCHRDRVQDVKLVVDQLKKENRDSYL